MYTESPFIFMKKNNNNNYDQHLASFATCDMLHMYLPVLNFNNVLWPSRKY